MLGAGMHGFTDGALERYRQAVLDEERGAQLEQAARAVGARPGVEIGGQSYKRVPAGLPADHPRAEWLRYSGLVAGSEQPLPNEVFSNPLPGLCFEHYKRVASIQQWLNDLLAD